MQKAASPVILKAGYCTVCTLEKIDQKQRSKDRQQMREEKLGTYFDAASGQNLELGSVFKEASRSFKHILSFEKDILQI